MLLVLVLPGDGQELERPRRFRLSLRDKEDRGFGAGGRRVGGSCSLPGSCLGCAGGWTRGCWTTATSPAPFSFHFKIGSRRLAETGLELQPQAQGLTGQVWVGWWRPATGPQATAAALRRLRKTLSARKDQRGQGSRRRVLPGVGCASPRTEVGVAGMGREVLNEVTLLVSRDTSGVACSKVRGHSKKQEELMPLSRGVSARACSWAGLGWWP